MNESGVDTRKINVKIGRQLRGEKTVMFTRDKVCQEWRRAMLKQIKNYH